MTQTSDPSIVRRLGWLSASKLLQSLMSFVAISYIAQVVGPTSFGIVGFATQIVSYFLLLSSLGIPVLAMREVAVTQNLGLIVGRTVPVTVILASMSYGLIWIIEPTMHFGPTEQMVVNILGLQVLISAFSLSWALSGKGLTNISAWAYLLGTTIRVGLLLLCIRHPNNLNWIPILTVVGTGITVAWQWIGILRFTAISWRFSWLTFYTTIRKSLPLSASSVMTQIYSSLDTVFLAYMVNLQTVGYYNAAYRIVFFLGGFSTLYSQILIPSATRLFLQSPRALKQQLSTSLTISAMIVLPITVGGSILARSIIDAIYQVRFEPAAIPLVILMWTWPITFTTLHYGHMLIAVGRERTFAQGIAVGAILNVIINLLLIPDFGASGSAMAIVLTEFSILMLMMKKMCHILGTYGPNRSLFLKTVFSTAVMASYLLFVRDCVPLILSVSSAAVLYGMAMIATKTWTQRDWHYLLSMIKRDSWPHHHPQA